MKTKFQYTLQLCRALATELRISLEELDEFREEKTGFYEESFDFVAAASSSVEEVEIFLDNLTDFQPKVIGKGSVGVIIESYEYNTQPLSRSTPGEI